MRLASSLLAALLALAGPVAAAEHAVVKRKAATAAPESGPVTATVPASEVGAASLRSKAAAKSGPADPAAGSEAAVDAAYTAARKAADKRQADWDRKMKQLANDVCTGC